MEASNVSSRLLYHTMVADPPWPITRPGNPKAPPYPLMQIEEIKLLRPQRLVAESAHLYLWTTQDFVCAGREVMEAWGFFPRTLLTWAKPGFSLGRRFRSSTEFFWFGERGREKFPITSQSIGTWFGWRTSGHSRKPEGFYELVEQISPGPYLELFARRQRLGWDTWGNESLEHVEVLA